MADEKNKKANPLEAKVIALEEIVASQAEAIETLQAAGKIQDTVKVVEKKPVITLPEDTFKVDGKEYKFKVPAARISGKKILATDALEDKALLKTIVAEYPGMVKEV